MKYRFSQIVEKEDGFLRGPFGSALKKSLFVPKGNDTFKVYEQCVPLEQNQNLGKYYITKEYYESALKKFSVKSGDFLISCSGVNYGAIIELKDPVEKGVINQALLRVRLNKKIVDSNYFLYLFKGLIYKKITRGSGDSTIPNFPPMDVVRNIEFDLPDLFTQKKIGSILKSIDDKIDANNCVNDKLQQLSVDVFSYWFKQFQFYNENGAPYKCSGGKMKYSPELKTEIPFDWEVKSLKDLLIKNNKSVVIKRNMDTIDLSVMPSDSFSLNKINNSDNFTTNLFEMNEGDLLFGSIRPYLHKAGIAPLNGYVAGTVHSYKVKNDYDYNFALMILTSKDLFDYAVKVSSGTKMPVVSSDNLLEYKFPYSKDISKKFSKIDIKSIVVKNIKENIKLQELRDFLLPLLMNGQVYIE